jgi:hypothetical protein
LVRANPYSAAFNAGELSPRLVGRTDFNKYGAGLAQALNCHVLLQGAVARRPGSRYVATVKNVGGFEGEESGSVVVRRFRFSNEQAYPLEIGDAYMRFYRNQGRIHIADTDAVVSNGDFTANITGWDDISSGGSSISHDASTGRLNLTGVGGATAIAQQDITTTDTGQEHVVVFQTFGVQADQVVVAVGTSSGGAQTVTRTVGIGWHAIAFTPTTSPFFLWFAAPAGQNKTVQIDDVRLLSDEPLEIGSPWITGQLRTLLSVQSNDLMYVAAGGTTPIYRLDRYGHTSWSLGLAYFEDGPYMDEPDNATTMTAAAATGYGVNVTASSITGVNGGRGFLTTDVGRLIRLQTSTNEPGWGIIRSRTSATVVVVDIKRSFGATTATTSWKLGAWSETTGYPRALAFFEQRFVAAGTTEQPQTFWMSQSADIQNMRPVSWDSDSSESIVEDDDGLDFTIAGEEVQTILWMSGGKQLVLGTASAQWTVDSDGPVITPNDISVRVQSDYAAADIAPVKVGNTLLFAQRSKRKLREFVFSFDVDGFIGRNMTNLADHITRSGIVEMAYQAESEGVLWAVRNDGRLICFTYDPLEEVRAWTPIEMGGEYADGPAVVESVTTLPGNDDAGQVYSSLERDEVWVIVKRTIDGQTMRYVEFFEALFEGPLLEDYETPEDWMDAVREAQADAFYVDSGITYTGTLTDTVTGADHLEGQTVKILADGAPHPDRVVSDGAVSLDAEYSTVHLGLGYPHKIKSLKIPAGAVAGTGVAKVKRIHGVALILLDSGGFQLGPTPQALFPVDFREASDPMDAPVALKTGERFQEFNGDWERDGRIYIESDLPLPFYMLAIAPEMKTNDIK